MFRQAIICGIFFNISVCRDFCTQSNLVEKKPLKVQLAAYSKITRNACSFFLYSFHYRLHLPNWYVHRTAIKIQKAN